MSALTRLRTLTAYSRFVGTTGVGHAIGIVGFFLPVVSLYAGLAAAPLMLLATAAALATYRGNHRAWPSLPRKAGTVLVIALVWASISIGWTTEPIVDAAWKLVRLAVMCAAGLTLVASIASMSAAALAPLRLWVPAGIATALTLMLIEATTGAPILHAFTGPLPPYWPDVLDRFDRGIAVLALLVWPAAAMLSGHRRIGVALVAAVVASLTLFSSTAALVAMGVGIAAAAAAFVGPKQLPLLAIIGCGAIVLISPLAAGFGPLPEEAPLGKPGFANSIDHRLIIWRFTSDKIADRPVRGWGFDSARSIPGGNGPIAPTATLLPLHPHNGSLQLWLELGAPGALLGAALLLCCVDPIRRLGRSPYLTAAATGLIASSFTLANLSFGIWQSWWTATLFASVAFMTGAAKAADRTSRVDDSEAQGAERSVSVEQAALAGTEASGRGQSRRFRLLYFVTEDWYFWSHRLHIADAALRAGCEVIVVTRAKDYAAAMRARGFRVINIHLQRGRMLSLLEFLTLAEIVAIYWRERPDLVHHVGLKPVVYGGFAASLTGVKRRVNALGGLGYIFMASKPHIRAIRAFFRYTLRRLLRHPGTWLILQNRDDMALFLGSRIADRARTVLIRGSGVDIDAFHPSPEPPAPIVAAQVSRMLVDKGIRDLAQAARLLHQRGCDVKILLVGQVDRHNPSVIPEDELRRWTAEGVIEWMGFRADIAALWRSAHIAVLASHREGLPKSLLEAAASGRPLVATDVPGNRELVIDNETGLLVSDQNPEALADAIARLAADPQLRARLGRNARDFVARELSDREVTTATVALYRRVAGAQWPNLPSSTPPTSSRTCVE